jgi:propionate CoA-transferase
MYVRVIEDVKAIWEICEQRCRAAGKRVGVIINYDRFRINEDMYDAYAEMDRYFLANYFIPARMPSFRSSRAATRAP